MKMGIFFGNLFWGILLILWGASLILKSFGVSLPLAKIFFCADHYPLWDQALGRGLLEMQERNQQRAYQGWKRRIHLGVFKSGN